jgi:hypothetical protein
MGHRYKVHMCLMFQGLVCEERVYRAKGCVDMDEGNG